MTRLIAIIAILLTLLAFGYFRHHIEQLRIDNDRTYAMAQRLEQRFIDNKMLMLEGKWKRE